jgi:predicted PurR-regulated permease PerM
MNLKLNIWPFIGVLLFIVMVFLFSKVFIYIAVSVFLFLIGYPITYRIESVKLKNKKIPDALAAIITIALLLGIFVLLFVLIVPPLIDQINSLSTLNFFDVVQNVLLQFPSLKTMMLQLGTEDALKHAIEKRLQGLVDAQNMSLVINNVFSYLGAITSGIFCVLFITFFFLKDEMIVKQSLLLVTPGKYEQQIRDVVRTSKRMLSGYFVGLLIDMFIVGTLVGLSLWVCGIKNALIIAVVAGLFNVIPYVGPIITFLVALFLGASSCIAFEHYELIRPVITKISLVLLTVYLLDALLIQPYIFSNTVKAHPLEVFLVTLMAGSIGGILGMIVAMPVYTLFRIIAKEFLTQFKFFKKITEQIPE